MVHKIICEVCFKHTTSGILVTDNGLRLRLYCSEKCLDKKIQEQDSGKKKRKGWLGAIFD